MPQFLAYLQEHHNDLYTDIVTMGTQPDSAPLLTRVNTGEFFKVLEEFLDAKKQDKTFAFFWTYMDMGQNLLAYTRAQISENFTIHINSFIQMLDGFMR